MKRACVLVYISALVCAISHAAPARSQMLNKPPLRFEPTGQAQSPFQARGSNFVLSLSPDRSVLAWRGAKTTSRITTKLVGANAGAAMDPEQRLDGAANYFLGSPQNWRTGVEGYGRIRHREIYPGIDLLFHGEGGRLEYDFVVAPHADPRRIRLELSGQQSIHIADDGDLVVHTAAGEVRWKRPEMFQESNGRREPVQGRFVLAGKKTVAFELAGYNRERALVIDPALAYSTFLGGSANEAARGIAVDKAGNVYIAGSTTSGDLNTASAVQPNFGGLTASVFSGDGFVAKFSASGTLLYLTYLGGSRDDGVSAIAVDASGNAYVTGGTTSLDFPVVNPYQSRFGGLGPGGIAAGVHTGDAFVAKLSPDGKRLLYSTYLGGNRDDVGLAIAIDSNGDAYITGATASQNFPLSDTPAQGRMIGAGGEPIKACCNGPFWESGDAFMTELDPTGSQVLYSTYLGGSQDDAGMAIAVDSSNNVYVGGCTISFDFPTTAGAFQRRYGGFDGRNVLFNFGDAFVTKYNSSGRQVYSTYIGGAGDECISGMAIDSAGDVFMTGSTTSNNLATPGVFQASYAGYNTLPLGMNHLYGDGYVAELNPAGSALVYFTYLGGSANDAATGIAIDQSGDAVIVGWTDSTNFPLSTAPYQSKLAGEGGQGVANDLYGDAFVALIGPGGTSLLYSTYLGGAADDGALGVALDPNGRVYVVGNTLSANFPTTSNAIQARYGGAKTAANGVAAIRSGAFFGDSFYTVFSGFPTAPPVITSVANAFGNSPQIAPNTWVAIKGTALSNTSRPWGDSDFTAGVLPTSLDSVSVTMGGKKAFVYYISPTQINVLTPPDLPTGTPIQVQVVNNGITSQPFTSQAATYSISFFVFNGGPYVIATHLDGTLVGPSTLFPGATSPAQAGETVIIYANGFGPVTPPVASGSITQSGQLPSLPPLQIGGTVANVTFAGVISPGLYQFNVVIPQSAKSGDNSIQSEYGGIITQSGTLITVQ